MVDGGRIIIIWNPDLVICEPLEILSQMIHCKIQDKTTSNSFICSLVYGASSLFERRDLWSSLISWGVNHVRPWILLGDFNSTLYPNERQGSLSPILAEREEFLSCATALGIEDIASVGNFFTWTNGSYWSKIDRVLVNAEWHNTGLNCMADFLNLHTRSDHAPVVVAFTTVNPLKSKPFRFLNMWKLHPSFNYVVRDTWQSPVYGTKQFVLCMKLKALKYPLKMLNKNAFSRISERVAAAQEDYSKAMNLLMASPHSDALKAHVKLCRSKANFLLEAERNFLQQKLKNTHLMQADRGTKYFHSLMRKRSSNCRVVALVKSNGAITTSQEEVSKEFLDYFKQLLSSDFPVTPTQDCVFNSGQILSEADCAHLSEPISDDMIRDALFHIGDDKSPGPDGYTSSFFKENWDLIKGDFLAGVHEFFQNGQLLKQLNQAAIALIPKT